MPDFDYQLGAQVRCSAVFVNSGGTEDDPSAILFRQRDPEGEVTPFVYGDDVELVRSATGRFYVLVDVDKPGTWTYRFEGTGDVTAADETTFTVAPSAFS